MVFALVRHHTHSVIFLKTHCFEQAFSYGLWPPDSVHYEGFYLTVFQSIVAALVLTKLDFNAPAAGIQVFQLRRLQAVMNTAARLVFF